MSEVIEIIAKKFNESYRRNNKKPSFICMSNENLNKLKKEATCRCWFENKNKGYYFEGMEICIRTTENDEIVVL